MCINASDNECVPAEKFGIGKDRVLVFQIIGDLF